MGNTATGNTPVNHTVLINCKYMVDTKSGYLNSFYCFIVFSTFPQRPCVLWWLLRNMLSFYFYSTHVKTLSCPSGCWSGLAEALASQPNSKGSSRMPINSAMCPKDSYDLQAANNPGQEEVWVQCKRTECLQKETWEIKTEQAISQRSECLLSNAASRGAFLRSGAHTHTHTHTEPGAYNSYMI